MAISVLDKSHIPLCIPLLQKFFPVHNKLQADQASIESYLSEQAEANTLIGLIENDAVQSVMVLVETGRNSDGNHRRYKFRHFAFDSDESAAQLLEYAEQWILDQSPTAKIELTIAESEPGKEFYLSQGYAQEASLSHHYRWDETCYILGKSLKGQ